MGSESAGCFGLPCRGAVGAKNGVFTCRQGSRQGCARRPTPFFLLLTNQIISYDRPNIISCVDNAPNVNDAALSANRIHVSYIKTTVLLYTYKAQNLSLPDLPRMKEEFKVNNKHEQLV